MELKHGDRIGGLDGMRGVAAMAVLLYHYTWKFRSEFGHDFPAWLDFGRGLYGVQLFFMISGFVIFMTANGCMTWGEFLVKRISRLYPTYWVCLAITFTAITVFFLSDKRSTDLHEGLVNITMLQTMFNVKSVDGAYWSLYPELLFYAIVSIVMAFGALRHLQWIGLAWLALVWHGPIHLPGIRLDLEWGGFFLAGITGYRIAMMGERTWFNYAYLVLTFVVNLKANHQWVVYPVIYAVFLLFVFGRAPFLSHPWLRYLGTISYALYLIHQNIGYLIIKNLRAVGIPDVLAVVIAIGGAIGMAHLITFKFEKPVIPRFRKALFRLKGRIAGVPATAAS